MGRGRELAALTELYQEAQRGGERLALLVGPSGVGKSRILAAFGSRIRLAGGVVLEGRCEPGRAFGPFAEIVERALKFLDEVDARTSIDLRALGCRAECHRFWYQHGGDGHEAPASLDGGPRVLRDVLAEEAALEQRLRFFDAVHGLLQDVSRVRAPVILLHGLERADSGTYELLRFLLDGAGPASQGVRTGRELPALFVASLRDTRDGDRPLEALVRHPSARRVAVSTLDEDGVRQYLQSRATVARVLERTGGFPEQIDLLLESDPLTPEGRLQRQLDALGAGARALVEALAVVGEPADVELLAAVTGPERRIDGAARTEFGRLGWLARSIVDGRILFRFARDGDRQRTYALLDPAARREMHARCVDAFLATEPARSESAARHALAAELPERAVPVALEAARSLEARHAQTEAARLLEEVLEAVGEARCPRALREHLVDLYRVSGDYRRGLVHARALAETGPTSPRAAHRLGQLLTLAGHFAEGARELERARVLASEHGDPSAVREVEALLAECLYQRAMYGEARRWAERALVAVADDELLLELHARNTLGKLHLAQKDPHGAAALFDENRAKASRAGLGRQEAQALTNLGVALLRQQRLDEAQASFERAIEVATAANDTREQAISTENLAVLAHLRRDYAHAQVLYHHAVTLLKRLGNRAMLARVAYNLGQLYLGLGERGRARTLCDFASHVGGSNLPPSVAGEGLFLRGRLEAACGDTHAARAAFASARQIFHDLQESWEGEADLEIARLHLADGAVDEAEAILDQLPPRHPPKREVEVALLAVDVARARGAATLTAARHAATLADRVGDPELQLPAQLRLSRALLDAEDLGAATRALERAQAVESDLTERVPQESLEVWAERAARAELASMEARIAAAWQHARPSFVPQATPSATPRPAPRPAAEPAPRRAGPGGRWERWAEAYPHIVGRSETLAQVLSVLDKVAPSGATVLVRGESGTGKELVADALHRASPRRDRPFVKVNCAALVETLLLSELFGHERGAFTGAQARRKGRFELADGGTIFLDEIGDISPKTQVALLRVLQEREFERVGGTQPIKVDVRIVAATNRDLEAMVREGTFREDLYYRLRGVVVEMPALRDRVEDLPLLCEHLLGRIAEERGEPPKRLSRPAQSLLARHRWPGNVRELENVLRSATLFADADVLGPEDFSAFFEATPEAPPAPEASGGDPEPETAGHPDDADSVETIVYRQVRAGDRSLFEMKKVLERECIVRALSETRGNITQAANLLGMKRPRLSQLVKQYGLNDVHEGAAE